ncbi:MAG: hypothetical protein NVSMB65_09620 [Chloroflexota bacterium]
MWHQDMPAPPAATRVRRWGFSAVAILIALVVATIATSPGVSGAGARDSSDRVSGAGKTMIEGGTGGSTPMPVTTVVAFHAGPQGGAFECLALMPAQATGQGSGEFTVNAMYVTGRVTSVDVTGETATMQGTATVTGLGAGHDVPFTAHVTAGGPGTTVTLEVSGMTFHEILLEGRISVD